MKDKLTNTNNNYPSREYQESNSNEYEIEGSQHTYNRGHKNTEIGFFDAIRICIMEKYATFRGRATRAEFWYFVLFHTILITFSSFWMEGANSGYMAEMAWRLYWMAYIGLFIPLISVTVRRLHDIGRSGWWYLTPFSWLFCALDSQKCDNEYGPYIRH